MESSRELDALIELTFKLNEPRMNEYFYNNYIKDPEAKDAEYEKYGMRNPILHYSTNESDVFQLVELLNNMGFGVSVYTQKGFDCAIDVYYNTQSTITYNFGSGDTVARAKTVPLAICKAALRIVGVDTE